MKIEKKHWIIVGVVAVIILIWYFFLRKKKTTTSNTTSNYAGLYGSFGNESSYAKNWLTNGFPNLESNYRTNTVFCPNGTVLMNGKCVPYNTQSSYVKKCLCNQPPSQHTGEPIFSEKCCGKSVPMNKVDPGPGGFGPVNQPSVKR